MMISDNDRAQNDQGNAKFVEGDFGGAVLFYNQAIKKVKDQAPLYCNRAHAHLKLGNYALAKEDCDAALLVNPVSLEEQMQA